MSTLVTCTTCGLLYSRQRDRKAGCPGCDKASVADSPNPILNQEEKVANFYPSAYEEFLRLRKVAVPASFRPRSRWPDTPEAQAARLQIKVAQGKD